jgi:hypothetical protein
VPGLDEPIALSKLTVDFGVFEDVPDLRKFTNLTRLRLRGWSSGAAGVNFEELAQFAGPQNILLLWTAAG